MYQKANVRAKSRNSSIHDGLQCQVVGITNIIDEQCRNSADTAVPFEGLYIQGHHQFEVISLIEFDF